jgi:hypothetical protein
MKCPKCNYTSFDHNESCPKCKKSLVQVREKLNLFAYSLAVPLSAQLAGQVSTGAKHDEQEPDFDLEFGDDLDSEIRFESGPTPKAATSDAGFSFEDETEVLSLDLDTLVVDKKSKAVKAKPSVPSQDSLEEELDFSLGDNTDELTLDFDEPEIQKTESFPSRPSQPADDPITSSIDSEDLTLDLGDTGVNMPDPMDAKQKEKVTLELEESVSALISDIELANSPSSSAKERKPESDLEVMDLDLDLDLDSLDDK